MLAWRIAWRYLFSKKSHGVVNIISIISVAGVAVATAAIVIVLSVFNGFADLASSHLAAIDPDIKVVPAHGKTFANADSMAAALRALPSVAAAQPVVEERGLLMAQDRQKPVIFKGIGPQYASAVAIDQAVIDGSRMDSAYSIPATLLSVGTALGLEARPGAMLSLYVPRRVGRINPANPGAAFRGAEVMATGVFQINQPDYDNDHIFIPLDVAREILEYETECTQLELAIIPGADPQAAAREIEKSIGDVRALTRAQQEENSFKMIQIEKWVTFLMLAFILVIASFNIISTLSLLVIEKSKNMQTLRALGATKGLTANVFVCEGCLISVAGGVAGIVIGTILVLVQQWGHVIKLAGDPAQLAIAYYPVRLMGTDLLIVLALVAAVALVSSQATRLFTSYRDDN